jgi:hypothetical protein
MDNKVIPQNTSSAVMQQKKIRVKKKEKQEVIDLFPTPPWGTRALCEYAVDLKGKSVWEPACGFGHMSRALIEYADSVISSDKYEHGYGNLYDFLAVDNPVPPPTCDWIITNPPFSLAEEFIIQSIPLVNVGVAMLVRIAFLESVGRYNTLFANLPPTSIWQYTERVPMLEGRLVRKASSATAYTWLIWDVETMFPVNGESHPYTTTFNWIPPCRKRLEKDSDYEPLSE